MASVSTLALWGCNQKSIENSIAEINKITEPTNTEVNEMIFNNVAQMKAATLAEGVVTSTVGYTSFNDGGQATYAVKTLVEFGSTPNELSDITLANGNVAVLMINGDAWNLKQFGAIGDDLADDTLSLQAMADKGGRMYMPRGVYRTSAQITFERFGYVYGESAGVGLGGGSWNSLLTEAEQGATIIHPDVSGFTGGAVFNFEYLASTSSCSSLSTFTP